MSRIKLSNNFFLDEFTRSQTAIRKSIKNNPDEQIIINLTHLCLSILQPLRNAVAASVNISSGYRSVALNVAVGGSESSQHCLGMAADITVSGMSCKEVVEKIISLGLDFDQLIYEGTWVHVSYNPFGKNRNQVLEAQFTEQEDGTTTVSYSSYTIN